MFFLAHNDPVWIALGIGAGIAIGMAIVAGLLSTRRK